MRQLLLALFILLAGSASGQPTIGIGIGGGDCQGVIRQITQDWFSVRQIMSSDSGLKRPPTSQFRCISPAYMNGAMQRHVGTTQLRCYTLEQTGVCCDADMQFCATL